MSSVADLRTLRRRVRSGEMPSELVNELRGVALRLARTHRLPPAFAPYGVWNDEGAEEAFAGWYAERLVAEGRLLELLDRSPDLQAFRRLSERSLRQFLINARDRSQAGNLYARLVRLLRETPSAYRLVQDASRPQDRWFGLAGTSSDTLWSQPERTLIAHAWALGDFTVIRYRAGAAKLSPVLDSEALEEFVTGLLTRTDSALTPRLIMTALSARFALGEVEVGSLDAEVVPPAAQSSSPPEEVLQRETARYVREALTERQAAILVRSEDTVADIAVAVGCSAGTVVNEQRRIGILVAEATGDGRERDAVLNEIVDVLYSEDDG